jgi:hypothetical protein
LFALLAFLPISPVTAQSDLTTVTGTIHDPSGASVPNASVTVQNAGTGAERKATTDAGGVTASQAFQPAHTR